MPEVPKVFRRKIAKYGGSSFVGIPKKLLETGGMISLKVELDRLAGKARITLLGVENENNRR